MPTKYFRWLLFAAIQFGFLFGNNAQGAKEADFRDFFSIDLPPGFHVAKAPSAPDFDLYSVMKGDQSYVTIYVGNAPDLRAEKGDKQNTITEFTSRDTKIISKWNGTTLVGREAVVTVASNSWPTTIDAFTTTTRPDETIVADKILSSLKAKPIPPRP